MIVSMNPKHPIYSNDRCPNTFPCQKRLRTGEKFTLQKFVIEKNYKNYSSIKIKLDNTMRVLIYVLVIFLPIMAYDCDNMTISHQNYTDWCETNCTSDISACGCGPFQVELDQCMACQVSNCFLCSVYDSTKCDICNPGTSKQTIDGQALCVDGTQFCDIAYCSRCSVGNADKCIICDDGFQISSNGDACTVEGCPTNLIFNGEECTCPDGLYLIDEDCVTCVDNCVQCHDASTCDQCFIGFFVDVAGECSKCTSNCAECENQVSCSVCESGYVSDDDGGCEVLPEGVSGTFQQQGTIIQCTSGCLSCSQQQTCNQCQNGRYLNSASTCSPCPSTCLTCNNADSCTSCPSGKLLEDGNCVVCEDENCLTCYPSSYCQKCHQGYGSISGRCIKCDDQNCLQCSDAHICTLCERRYGVFGGQCVECLSGYASCQGDDISGGLECIDGYYLGDEKCQFCPEGCSSCSASDFCDGCKGGYQLIDNMCYEACVYPCSDCQKGNGSKCKSCFGGYLLEGSNCIADVECNQDNSCVACPQGYVLVDDGQGGQLCDVCQTEASCVRCSADDLTICTQCQGGSYLENDNCQLCPSQCSTCTASGCKVCSDGYFMVEVNGEETGVCEVCDAQVSFCETCSGSKSSCLSCLPDYTLAGIKCVSKTRIDVDLTLNTTIPEFLVKINDFKRGILEKLDSSYEDKLSWVTLNSIISGSVIVGSTVTIPQSEKPTDVLLNLEESLVEGTQLSGFQLLSSATVTPVNFPDTEEEIQESSNLGLALGLGIPLAIILMALIVILKMKVNPVEDQEEYLTEGLPRTDKQTQKGESEIKMNSGQTA